jgi:hypothetical protein
MLTLNQKEGIFPCLAEVDLLIRYGDHTGMSNESGMKK